MFFQKQHQREILSGVGNQIQALQDQGQYWDAWNIDPDYAQHPLPKTVLSPIEVIESGALRDQIRVTRRFNQSEFVQDYILDAKSPILKIVTQVNWQETHVFVKAAFPLIKTSDYATYEIPCGAIKRPTQPQTPQDKAKWEVSVLHWADFIDNSGDYGVSLLNDCRYGYDSQPSQLRLSLLRSPQAASPELTAGRSPVYLRSLPP